MTEAAYTTDPERAALLADMARTNAVRAAAWRIVRRTQGEVIEPEEDATVSAHLTAVQREYNATEGEVSVAILSQLQRGEQ